MFGFHWRTVAVKSSEVVSSKARLKVISTVFSWYDVASVVEPCTVRFDLRAGMKTCSVYVPGMMKRVWGVVVVLDKALTPDWTVLKEEELLVAELSTTIAPAGGEVLGTALLLRDLRSDCGREDAIQTRQAMTDKIYILKADTDTGFWVRRTLKRDIWLYLCSWKLRGKQYLSRPCYPRYLHENRMHTWKFAPLLVEHL